MALEQIEAQTLSSAAGTITFSSLGEYKDLMVVITGVQTSGANSVRVRVGNGSVDTGNNYSIVSTYYTGSGVGSTGGDGSSGYVYCTGDGSSTIYSNYLINFMDYRNTQKYKQVDAVSARSNVFIGMDNFIWKSTSAITVISFAYGASFPDASFAAGTKAILYGIR